MTIYTACSNSTLYDVCLNTYGTLNLLVKLMVDNNIAGINVYPENNQEFIFDETMVSKQITKTVTVKYATR